MWWGAWDFERKNLTLKKREGKRNGKSKQGILEASGHKARPPRQLRGNLGMGHVRCPLALSAEGDLRGGAGACSAGVAEGNNYFMVMAQELSTPHL